MNLDRSGHISSACRLFLFAALLTGVACSTQMVEDWHRASEVSDQAVLLWWQARRQVILQSPSLERLLAEADQGENVVINSLRPLGRSIFKFFIWRFKLRYPERWLQQVAQARVFAKTEMALANPEGATAIKDFYQKSDQKIFRDIIGQDISNERFNAYVLSKGQGIPAEILEKNIVPFLIEG